MQFKVGNFSAEPLVDVELFEPSIAGIFPDAKRDEIERSRSLFEPDHIDVGRGVLRLAIQSFVLHAPHATILIDTCVGEGKARPLIPEWNYRTSSGYLDRLAQIGLHPESVDLVVCTHLHLDHVGWNTRSDDGRWVSTFPNARYLVGRRELAFWEHEHRNPDKLAMPHLTAFEDSVLPILESGQAELVDDGYDLGHGITLMPLPGHTPGQMGVQVAGGVRTLFCGDAIHSPLQTLDPSLSTASCADPEEARRVRRAVLEDAAECGRLIVPAHLRGARRMTIQKTTSGFIPRFPDSADSKKTDFDP
jgi:glyoxylase-like metal-dependent hydrolase (beta-lactamase superfamily II)